MPESLAAKLIQSSFTGMSKRCMPQIMSQGNCLCQLFIQPQLFFKRTGVLGDLQGVRQSGTVLISSPSQKHLRLMLQTPERLTVQNSIPISLIDGADITGRFINIPSSGIFA